MNDCSNSEYFQPPIYPYPYPYPYPSYSYPIYNNYGYYPRTYYPYYRRRRFI